MIALLLISIYAADFKYTFDQRATESRFLLVESEKVLIYNDVERRKLVVFSLANGGRLSEISLTDDYWVGNFAYIRTASKINKAKYGLNTLRRSPDGGLERKVVFYDANFKLVGYGKDENANPSNPFDIFYRQFLSTNDRLFVNIWKRSGIYASETRMLQEIELEESENEVNITYRGAPFLQDFSAPDTIASNIKTKYIITNPGDEDQIFVVEELGRIWEFGISSTPNQNWDLEAKGFHTPVLSSWQKPDRKRENDSDFFTSFSRVVAAYPRQNDMLIGYRSPVAGVDKQELILQSVEYNMEIGAHEVLDASSILLGVCLDSQKDIWIGKLQGDQLKMERRPFGQD